MKLLFAFFACLLFGVMVNAQPADFRPLVQKALQNGEKRIVIPPGVYRLVPIAGQGAIWTLSNARDVEIVADNVTLTGTKLTLGLTLNRCRNVTLQGLTLDYDPLPFTQGTVVAVAENKDSIDIQIHDGYPRQPYARIDLVDPQTRFRKKGMPFLWGTKAALIAPDTVRITLKGIGEAASHGDLASLSTGPETNMPPHGITLESCAGMTLRNVTVHSAPGMGIIESDGEGGNRYLGCKIVRGPKPPGATQERLLTTSWDALQSKFTKIGPLVENCVIKEAGDDSWSVQSSDFLIVKSKGKELTLAFRDEWTDGLQIGDAIQTSLDGPQARIMARKIVRRDAANLAPEVLERLKAASPYSLWNVSPKCMEITLDRELPFSLGASVYSPDRQGNGFIFRNNQIHSPGRILIKAGGLIENNHLDTPHNLMVCPEVPGEAAAGIQNLTIRGNTIRQAGYFCPAPWSAAAGAISITASLSPPQLRSAGVFKNIVIENNTFEDICGPNLVVTSARDVKIRNNRILNAGQVKSKNTGESYHVALDSLIWIKQCENVHMQNNDIINPGPFVGQAVVLGSNR
ncbi:MAG TPA: right-handed parallel beta-helix repeat-containing protein [Abditibacteriaceae bacterium]